MFVVARSIILFIFINLITVIDAQESTPMECLCGTGTSNEGDLCNFDYYEGGTVSSPTGCTCLNPSDQIIIEDKLGDYYGVCKAAETTIRPTDPPEEIFEEEKNDDDDDDVILTYGNCSFTELEGGKKTMSKVFFYFGSIWVILWTIGTIVINVVFKEKGHHRFIGICEEITIIVLFIFLGFFVWGPFDSSDFCKATTIILHFTLILFLGFCVMEVVFANSMITGKSDLNGAAPPLLNYILPVVIALIPTIVSFFALKKYYAASGVHCFVMVYSDMLWAWAIPTWILFVIGVIMGQLAFLACIQEQLDVNKPQIFWAKKCCKALPPFLTTFLSAYFMAMFALDFQKLGLAIVFLLLCLILGPLIFVVHTYCYVNTATKLWKSTSLPIYKPCPGEENPPENTEPEKEPEEEPKEEPEAPVPPPEEAPKEQQPPKKENPASAPKNKPKPPPGKPMDPFHDPTKSQEFYDWVTDRNPDNIVDSEKILFKPRAV